MLKTVMPWVLTLVSAILVFIGKDEFVLKDVIKVQTAHLPLYMNAAFFVGIAYPLIVVQIKLFVTQAEKKKLEDALPSLLRIMRESFNVELKASLRPPGEVDFNIRIFFPVRGTMKLWRRLYYGEKYFKIKKVEGLATDDLTKELIFRVAPQKPQGLVGLTFEQRTILYDIQPKQPAGKYNLDEFHKNHTSRTEFIATAPILTPKGKIIAIMSIDSTSVITVNGTAKTKLEEHMRGYCKHLDKFLPLIK
jgi:hypothetical protein